MLHFSKLRIQGFKSFVDKTELEIAPGLNGIVGPNGCGKSNLVEALRWVMGEGSAKRMRGDGMEDVIFAGADNRSARNIAEVSLLLDNKDRSAPPSYNGEEEIEVVRKIERDRGSLYKINGKTVRARDVQMLFADTVTGANSPALVSQGRVAEIINAKPQSRRQILEESAGISGLYARRHEAELRLRGADRNLERIDDILGNIETQLNSLKRQARQASRYRNLGAQIRQLEITIAHREWTSISERITALKKTFSEAESIVADKIALVAQLTKTQTTQAADLPDLRKAETEISAALQVQKISLQRLEEDAARYKEHLEELLMQLEQTKTDTKHEEQSLEESTLNLTKLEGEFETLSNRQKSEAEKLPELEKQRDELERRSIAVEEKYTTLMKNEAEANARKESLTRQIEQNKSRIEKLQERRAQAQADLAELENNEDTVKEIKNLQSLVSKLTATAEDTINKITEKEKQREDILKDVQSARDSLKKAEQEENALATEIKTLETFFESESNGDFIPVLDDVIPDNGFETALSRALGDSLMASLDSNAPSSWVKRSNVDVSHLPALPNDVSPILKHVKAHAVLAPALSQIGFITDEDAGENLAKELKPGQSLVSANGTYWRWDGYTVKAQATDRNARHLEQKNKLMSLNSSHPAKVEAVKAANKKLEDTIDAQNKLETALTDLRSVREKTERELVNVRTSLSNLRELAVQYESNVSRLNDIINVTNEDIATLEDVIRWDTERLNTHVENTDKDSDIDIAQVYEQLQKTRAAHQESIRTYDQQVQKDNSRKARLHAIADERISLQNRTIRSKERLKELNERLILLEDKNKELKSAKPIKDDSSKDNLLDSIKTLEDKRAEAADKLAKVEAELADTNKALKEAENILSDARESRAHAQATLSGIMEQQQALFSGIHEKFDMAPEHLAEHIVTSENDTPLDSLKEQKEQLIRQRDSIGPVNLRAEEELKTLEDESGGIITEREDLLKAIAELRKGITEINDEARERLSKAFDIVDTHFRELFGQLFNGGKAHLKLIDSDDPLEAGLEIYAQPPGKNLQSLSLLSGGEQALTSIALIFAMFLTNPSPICVMDEIDAPLDDANVDRVCNLLEDICSKSDTRFIIITHHRMTMARMHRLYGVTMAEKGISQLVSVDLQQSFEFLEAA